MISAPPLGRRFHFGRLQLTGFDVTEDRSRQAIETRATNGHLRDPFPPWPSDRRRRTVTDHMRSIMAKDMPNWFIEQFNNEAIPIYQNEGNVLRPTVCNAGEVSADKATWFLEGTGEAVEMDGSDSDARPMNSGRWKVSGSLKTWQAYELIKEFDADRAGPQERRSVIRIGAKALGRAADKAIINELDANASTSDPTCYVDFSAGNFTPASVLTMCTLLEDQDVSWDGEVYCPLPPLLWNMLMGYPQFTNSQYVGDQIPFVKRTATRFWNGVNFFMYPKRFFKVPSAGKLDLFMWHKSAIGWGNNTDLVTDWAWENKKTAWSMNSRAKGLAKALMKPGGDTSQATGIIRARVSSTGAITMN